MDGGSHQTLPVGDAAETVRLEEGAGLAPFHLPPVPGMVSPASCLHPGRGSCFLEQELSLSAGFSSHSTCPASRAEIPLRPVPLPSKPSSSSKIGVLTNSIAPALGVVWRLASSSHFLWDTLGSSDPFSHATNNFVSGENLSYSELSVRMAPVAPDPYRRIGPEPEGVLAEGRVRKTCTKRRTNEG